MFSRVAHIRAEMAQSKKQKIARRPKKAIGKPNKPRRMHGGAGDFAKFVEIVKSLSIIDDDMKEEMILYLGHIANIYDRIEDTQIPDDFWTAPLRNGYIVADLYDRINALNNTVYDAAEVSDVVGRLTTMYEETPDVAAKGDVADQIYKLVTSFAEKKAGIWKPKFGIRANEHMPEKYINPLFVYFILTLNHPDFLANFGKFGEIAHDAWALSKLLDTKLNPITPAQFSKLIEHDENMGYNRIRQLRSFDNLSTQMKVPAPPIAGTDTKELPSRTLNLDIMSAILTLHVFRKLESGFLCNEVTINGNDATIKCIKGSKDTAMPAMPKWNLNLNNLNFESTLINVHDTAVVKSLKNNFNHYWHERATPEVKTRYKNSISNAYGTISSKFDNNNQNMFDLNVNSLAEKFHTILMKETPRVERLPSIGNGTANNAPVVRPPQTMTGLQDQSIIKVDTTPGVEIYSNASGPHPDTSTTDGEYVVTKRIAMWPGYLPDKFANDEWVKKHIITIYELNKPNIYLIVLVPKPEYTNVPTGTSKYFLLTDKHLRAVKVTLINNGATGKLPADNTLLSQKGGTCTIRSIRCIT